MILLIYKTASNTIFESIQNSELTLPLKNIHRSKETWHVSECKLASQSTATTFSGTVFESSWVQIPSRMSEHLK